MNWILRNVDMEIFDVSLNNVNGGSITIFISNINHNYNTNKNKIDELIEKRISCQL